MRPIDSLLDSFQIHYSDSTKTLHYTDANRVELVRRYMWIAPAYMLALYDEVTSTHPASLRSLPDTAVIEAAITRLGRQEAYTHPKQIEDQREVNEDLVRRLILDAVDKGNEIDRQRVRDRERRGEATAQERWWLEHLDKPWRAMPKGWGE